MPHRALVLLNILLILVLTLTCLSRTALPCGMFSSRPRDRQEQLVHWREGQHSILQHFVEGARGQRSPAACWRYRATPTAPLRVLSFVGAAVWDVKTPAGPVITTGSGVYLQRAHFSFVSEVFRSTTGGFVERSDDGMRLYKLQHCLMC